MIVPTPSTTSRAPNMRAHRAASRPTTAPSMTRSTMLGTSRSDEADDDAAAREDEGDGAVS